MMVSNSTKARVEGTLAPPVGRLVGSAQLG
jgi:hypothetical protein